MIRLRIVAIREVSQPLNIYNEYQYSQDILLINLSIDQSHWPVNQSISQIDKLIDQTHWLITLTNQSINQPSQSIDQSD